jgi:hypothetical protein
MIRAIAGRRWAYVFAMTLCSIAFAATGDSAKPQAVFLGVVLNPESDDTLAFTPDGNTVFFDRSVGKTKTILMGVPLISVPKVPVLSLGNHSG